MSRNLDGAGSLRTVPASFIFQHFRGRADAQSALALGRVTGARLVLFGGLLAAGDSVRATTVLFDAATGRTLAELERRDVASRIDRLSDSLTVAVLRELGRTRRIDISRATSSATTSLPALKAYLQGEQFYRATLWDSAQARFERAIGIDSTFALAYHRLAAIRQWRDPNDYPDSAAFDLMRRTSHFARGLGPRERLLAEIDSLSAEAYFAWRRGLGDVRGYDDEQIIVGRLIAAIGDGLLRYRHDPELSFLLAEARSRYDRDVVEGEIDDREVLGLYDHAIGMDSSFAPAYITPISLAAYLDGAESARRYIRAYLALEPSGSHSQIIRLADALLDPARGLSIDVGRLVDTLPPSGLCEASTLLRHIPDETELLVRIARALEAHPTEGGMAVSEPGCAIVAAVDGLQFRGHLREAHRLTLQQAHWMGPAVLYNMAKMGMVPADTARTEFRRVLSLLPRTTMTKLYRWWATDGDTAAIQTYIKHFRSPGGHRTISADALVRASAAAGQAYLALAKHDTASALRQFLTTPDTLHACWYDHRVTIAQLLVATGRYAEAAKRLERRWPGTTGCSNGFDDIVWTLERARVFERLGRREEAATNYAFVADAWRSADPELQPYVRESRTAIARLNARPKH
jgi:serine/threonine-protein kinase